MHNEIPRLSGLPFDVYTVVLHSDRPTRRGRMLAMLRLGVARERGCVSIFLDVSHEAAALCKLR